jgi:hypothetical protein
MNLDIGKQMFDSFSAAEKVALSMRRTHKEAFKPYKVGNQWAIGGVHMKSTDKKIKVKSFDDMRALLYEYKESDDDTSVEDYVREIELESKTKVSSLQGDTSTWTLKNVDVKLGCDIGMSASNRNPYLVLGLEKGAEILTLKMGGKFARHIPLVQKQAKDLIGLEVIWHTWNNSQSNWGANEWFYLLEQK